MSNLKCPNFPKMSILLKCYPSLRPHKARTRAHTCTLSTHKKVRVKVSHQKCERSKGRLSHTHTHTHTHTLTFPASHPRCRISLLPATPVLAVFWMTSASARCRGLRMTVFRTEALDSKQLWGAESSPQCVVISMSNHNGHIDENYL